MSTRETSRQPRLSPAGERARRERAERLAQALRANLLRRKQQQRRRDRPPTEREPESGAS